MAAEQNLNDQDYELLSAYIDGMLSDSERAGLETRLINEPHLRRELDELRAAIALLKALPTMKAPRNFTLTVAQVGLRPAAQRRIIPIYMGALSAAAALLLIIFGVAILSSSPMALPATSGSSVQTAQEIAIQPTMTGEADLFYATDSQTQDNAPSQPPIGGAGGAALAPQPEATPDPANVESITTFESLPTEDEAAADTANSTSSALAFSAPAEDGTITAGEDAAAGLMMQMPEQQQTMDAVNAVSPPVQVLTDDNVTPEMSEESPQDMMPAVAALTTESPLTEEPLASISRQAEPSETAPAIVTEEISSVEPTAERDEAQKLVPVDSSNSLGITLIIVGVALLILVGSLFLRRRLP